ncbi:MAG: PTS system mannose/fructose/sorbose family transporter subunit IID [Bombilactobacillus sp.]
MTNKENTPKYHVTKKDLTRTSLRFNWICVNLFNYESQLGPSLVWSMAPLLRKIYPKDEDYKASLRNHFNYFNTTPYLTNLVLGTTIAMEERDGIKSLEAVQSFKTSIMGPLAGIGDTIFWVLWPTIMGSIAGYMALQGNPFGAIIWFGVNILFNIMKVWFFHVGYNSGTHLLDTLGNKINIFTEAASIMGITVIGALVATVVKVSVPFVFKFGKVSMNIQTDVLNKIMPALLPALFTYFIYKLLDNKKWTPTKIIFLVIGIALLGTFCGIFKA